MFTIEPPACAADELGQVGAVYKSRRAEKGRFYPVAYTSTHTRISLPPDGLPAASRLTISYCCLCAKSNRKQTLRNHKEYTHTKNGLLLRMTIEHRLQTKWKPLDELRYACRNVRHIYRTCLDAEHLLAVLLDSSTNGTCRSLSLQFFDVYPSFSPEG